MDETTIAYLIIIAAILITFIAASRMCSWSCDKKICASNENFTPEDQQNGKRALDELEEMMKNGASIPEISDEELAKLSEDIYLVKLPSENTKEKMSYFHTENTRYWPYYYYSFPYNYKYGGAWPPGMYSRLYYWAPGYYTGTGWSYYMRPGMDYKFWPRNRWIRHTKGGNQTYYYVTNRDEYTHNEGNYADTPLQPFGGGANP
jgi:hypothetical protein